MTRLIGAMHLSMVKGTSTKFCDVLTLPHLLKSAGQNGHRGVDRDARYASRYAGRYDDHCGYYCGDDDSPDCCSSWSGVNAMDDRYVSW